MGLKTMVTDAPMGGSMGDYGALKKWKKSSNLYRAEKVEKSSNLYRAKKVETNSNLISGCRFQITAFRF